MKGKIKDALHRLRFNHLTVVRAGDNVQSVQTAADCLEDLRTLEQELLVKEAKLARANIRLELLAHKLGVATDSLYNLELKVIESRKQKNNTADTGMEKLLVLVAAACGIQADEVAAYRAANSANVADTLVKLEATASRKLGLLQDVRGSLSGLTGKSAREVKKD